MQSIIDEHVANSSSVILELHNYDSTIYEQLIIPDIIEGYISDLCINKLILPENLHILDVAPVQNIDMDFNISKKLTNIILRDVNIINKSIMDLFPTNIRYRYVGCSLNGIPFNDAVNELYFKYFQKKPRCTNKDSFEQPIIHNIIYYRFHNAIIDEIKDHERLVLQAMKKNNMYKEELINEVYHPDRVVKGIHKYGMEFIDAL
jgi:hypothetical protein